MQKILMFFILTFSLTAFGIESHHGGGHGGGHGGHGGGHYPPHYPPRGGGSYPTPYVYQCLAQSQSGSQYYGNGYTQNDAANNALNICYRNTGLSCQVMWCR